MMPHIKITAIGALMLTVVPDSHEMNESKATKDEKAKSPRCENCTLLTTTFRRACARSCMVSLSEL